MLLVHGYPGVVAHVAARRSTRSPPAACTPSRPTSPASATASRGPPDQHLDAHVEALEALRQAEGLARVALVGHDWGG